MKKPSRKDLIKRIEAVMIDGAVIQVQASNKKYHTIAEAFICKPLDKMAQISQKELIIPTKTLVGDKLSMMGIQGSTRRYRIFPPTWEWYANRKPEGQVCFQATHTKIDYGGSLTLTNIGAAL